VRLHPGADLGLDLIVAGACDPVYGAAVHPRRHEVEGGPHFVALLVEVGVDVPARAMELQEAAGLRDDLLELAGGGEERRKAAA